MSLHTKIKEEAKRAFLDQDTVRTTVCRSILAALTYELMAKKAKEGEDAKDDVVLAIVKKLANQHKDSIEQFTKGGRKDLVKVEQAELKILQEFLPASLPRKEIEKVAKKVKQQLGVTDKAGMGKLIGAINKELKGQADGAEIKSVVESLF